MLDKLCLHFFCSCLQLSVLTRFVCRICLHFDPGFGGFFADKVCLQDLSAFWPSFWRIFCRQSLSAGFVCILARFWRIFCRQSLSTEFVCQDFLCRQSLSAEPLQTKFVCMSTSSSATSTRWQTLSTVDKLCLQYDKLCLQKFVCSNLARAWRVGGTWGRRNGRDADLWVCFGRYFGCMARFVCIMTRFVYIWQTLSTAWQSLSTHTTHMTNCLHMTNFVYTMTKFVTTSKLCHAFDKLCLHHTN